MVKKHITPEERVEISRLFKQRVPTPDRQIGRAVGVDDHARVSAQQHHASVQRAAGVLSDRGPTIV